MGNFEWKNELICHLMRKFENSEHSSKIWNEFLIHPHTCLCLMHFLCVQVHVIPLKVKISTFDKMYLMEHILRSKGKMCLKVKLVKGFKMVRIKFFPNSTLSFYTGKASVETEAKSFKTFQIFTIWNALTQ